MKISTTDGNEYWYPDFCPYCNLDTAGNHEFDCPMTKIDIDFQVKMQKLSREFIDWDMIVSPKPAQEKTKC